MTISPTTPESRLRNHLLDVIGAQWHELSVPVSTPFDPSDEVIDPEALIWASLEFIPTEPRLCEAVLAWLSAHDALIIKQRLNRRGAANDPRAIIWQALQPKKRARVRSNVEPPHGLETREQVAAFCNDLLKRLDQATQSAKKPGRLVPSSATSLVQARHLLGSDIRHFLLIYLLANPAGGNLKTIQRWSGYTYRSISATATRWTTARALTIDHGHARLTQLTPWHELLHSPSDRPVIVDWFSVFDACVHQLRFLADARRRNIPLDGPVAQSRDRQTRKTLDAALLSAPTPQTPWIKSLREAVGELASIAELVTRE